MTKMINQNVGKTMNITVNVNRKYNKQDISIGASVTIETTSGSALAAAYDDLYAEIMKQHRLLIEKAARELADTPAVAPPAPPAPPAPQTVTIDVTHINKEFKADKAYFKVKGGKFEKFGVRLWLDSSVIGDVDNWIDFDALPAGDSEPDEELKAVIQMRGDTPVKVLKLILADSEIEF
jgi:hypothetical protein